MILLVCLERVPARPIPDFLAVLSENSWTWRKVISNVWLVDTELDPGELGNMLRDHLTADDRVFVIRTQPQWWGLRRGSSVMLFDWLRRRNRLRW